MDKNEELRRWSKRGWKPYIPKTRGDPDTRQDKLEEGIQESWEIIKRLLKE